MGMMWLTSEGYNLINMFFLLLYKKYLTLCFFYYIVVNKWQLFILPQIIPMLKPSFRAWIIPALVLTVWSFLLPDVQWMTLFSAVPFQYKLSLSLWDTLPRPSEVYKKLNIPYISTLDVAQNKWKYNGIFVHPFYDLSRLLSVDTLEKIKSKEELEYRLVALYNQKVIEYNKMKIVLSDFERNPEQRSVYLDHLVWEITQVIEIIEEYYVLSNISQPTIIFMWKQDNRQTEVHEQTVIVKMLNLISPQNAVFAETQYSWSGLVDKGTSGYANQLLNDTAIVVWWGYTEWCLGTTQAIFNLTNKSGFCKVSAGASNAFTEIYTQLSDWITKNWFSFQECRNINEILEGSSRFRAYLLNVTEKELSEQEQNSIPILKGAYGY